MFRPSLHPPIIHFDISLVVYSHGNAADIGSMHDHISTICQEVNAVCCSVCSCVCSEIAVRSNFSIITATIALLLTSSTPNTSYA